MIRSRWLALQAATLILGTSVVPSIQAQGRCPFTAGLQMQLQTRYMPPPPMMMPQIPMQQQFQPRMPILTPPRMPNNFGVPQFHPPYNVGVPHTPNFSTPAFTARIPTFTPNFHVNTNTTWRTNTNTQLHTMHFPTLSFNTHTWNVRTPNFVSTQWHGPGIHTGTWAPRINWNLAMGLKIIPKFGIGTARWSTTTTSSTPFNTTRWTGNLTVGNRSLNFPSLSFNRRPTFVPTLARIGGPNPLAPNRPGVVGPNTTQVRAPKFPLTNPAAKPGTNSTSLAVTGRLNFNCGSCHNCKQPAQINPGLVAARPVPTFRPPVLPAQLPPPLLLPRPMPVLTQVAPQPIIRQPLSPIILLSGTQPLPLPPLTLTPPLILTANPKLMPVFGKTLETPTPSLLATSSLKTDLIATTPPVPTKAVITKTPLVVADLAPPVLPQVARPDANKMQVTTILEMIGATEAEKPAVRPTQAQGPALVVTLLQPPPLPSGAPVTPVELLHPVLDEPPVLPALVDTLIQPPALPPLPGA